AAQSVAQSGNYGQTFAAAATWTIPDTMHTIGHSNIRVQCWDNGTPRRRVAGRIQVDAAHTVTVQWLQPQAGLVVLQGALPTDPLRGNNLFSFPASLTWQVAGTAHGFGTDHLLLDAYDASTPRQWLPNADITLDPTTYNITVTWLQPQAGVLVVSGFATAGTTN